MVDEAAEFALTHPPAPISKREVPKTNRFMVAAGGPRSVSLGCERVLCTLIDGFLFLLNFAGLEQALNTAFNAQPLMVAPGGIIKCFEAACSGKSFREGVAVEMEEFTKLVPWPFSPDFDSKLVSNHSRHVEPFEQHTRQMFEQ